MAVRDAIVVDILVGMMLNDDVGSDVAYPQ
jgi:hypothetical protein